MNRDDFKSLSAKRLAEAKTLFKAGQYDGAYYLAGYSIECALKACIASQTKRNDFPPPKETIYQIYTHDLQKLVIQAQLRVHLEARRAAESRFDANWAIVLKWSEIARYSTSITMADADSMLKAITQPRYGILPWIRSHS